MLFSLVVTRGHSWSLVVTRGHPWSFVVIRVYFLDTIFTKCPLSRSGFRRVLKDGV